MARAEISVQFQGGFEEGPSRRYRPGERVFGHVYVRPDGDVKCNHLYVKLQWRTEGRGDLDQRELSRLDVYQGELSGATAAAFPFQFQSPLEPWSYAGHYVSIVWEIAVDVDVPWSVNPRYSQRFVLRPVLGDTPVSAEEVALYDLTLLTTGPHFDRLLEALLLLAPGLGRDGAQAVATSVPCRVLWGVSREEAERGRRQLAALGCETQLSQTGM